MVDISTIGGKKFQKKYVLPRDGKDYIFIVLICLAAIFCTYYISNNGKIETENANLVLTVILITEFSLFATLSDRKYLGTTFMGAYIYRKGLFTIGYTVIFVFFIPIILFIFSNYGVGVVQFNYINIYNFLVINSAILTIYAISDVVYNYASWSSGGEQYRNYTLLNLVNEKNIASIYNNSDIFLINQELAKLEFYDLVNLIKYRDKYMEIHLDGYKNGKFIKTSDTYDVQISILFDYLSSFRRTDEKIVELDIQNIFEEFYRQKYKKLVIDEGNTTCDIDHSKLTLEYFLMPLQNGISFSKNNIPTSFECWLLKDYIMNIDVKGNETYYLEKMIDKFIINRTDEIFISNFTTYLLIEIYNQNKKYSRHTRIDFNDEKDIVVKAFSYIVLQKYENDELINFLIKWDEIKHSSTLYSIDYVLVMLKDYSIITKCIKLLEEIRYQSSFITLIGEEESNDNIYDAICKSLINDFENKIYELWKNKLNNIFLTKKDMVIYEITQFIIENGDIFHYERITDNFINELDNETKEKMLKIITDKVDMNVFLHQHLYKELGGNINDLYIEEFNDYIEEKYSRVSLENINQSDIDILIEDINLGYTNYRGAIYNIWYIIYKYFFIYAANKQKELIKIFQNNSKFIGHLVYYLEENKIDIDFKVENYLLELSNNNSFENIIVLSNITSYLNGINNIEIDNQTMSNFLDCKVDISSIIKKSNISNITNFTIPYRVDINWCHASNYIAFIELIANNINMLDNDTFIAIYYMLYNTNMHSDENINIFKSLEYRLLEKAMKNYASSNEFDNIEGFLDSKIFDKFE